MKQKVLGVIPARLKSTRMPEKMLALIAGKPLIYYTWRQAKKAKTLDAVIVATDSRKIYDVVTQFGGESVMTPTTINSGSDRVAYASKRYKKFRPDIVVNIQGDEPLIPPLAIDDTVRAIVKNKTVIMATPAVPFSLVKQKDIKSPNFVKVILDKNGDAIYFSRSVIPHPRDQYKNYLNHLGLYGYRYSFLQKYTTLKNTPLEKAEKLEQLRALENGYKIRVVVGPYKTFEVNTLQEFKVVKARIEKEK